MTRYQRAIRRTLGAAAVLASVGCNDFLTVENPNVVDVSAIDPVKDATTLALSAQQNFASQTPGASTVEAVDLQDLIAFANGFDVGLAGALGQLLSLAQSVMTNVGVPELMRRLDSLQRGTARNPPNAAESRALAFVRAPSLAAAAELLSELRALPNVRVHRPAILYGALKALRDASAGTVATSWSPTMISVGIVIFSSCSVTPARVITPVTARVMPMRSFAIIFLFHSCLSAVRVGSFRNFLPNMIPITWSATTPSPIQRAMMFSIR
jgi:hypothetical protein